MNSSLSVEPGPESRLRALWPWLAVFVFLLPISISIYDVGVSANYSFLVLLLFLNKVETWPRLIVATVVYSGICYLFGTLVASDTGANFYVRQSISFFLFFGAVLISVARMPFDFQLLARVIVTVSVCYALLVAIAIIFTGIPISNAGMAKARLAELVPDWPQRFIIVVMLGFLLALYLGRNSKHWLIAAGLCGFCIVVSHIRAAYLSMSVAMILLAAIYSRNREWGKLKNLAYALILSLILVAAFAGGDVADFQMALISKSDNLDSMVHRKGTLKLDNLENDALVSHFCLESSSQETRTKVEHYYMEGREASGRIRLEFWRSLLCRMIHDQMWLGSGFAGPYLFDDAIGSAHSQYIDVLFRMGPIGLALYLGLWGVFVWHCFRKSAELGSGMLGWFVYGLFHETTKLSYGAFIFFALLSLAWSGWERQNALKP